MSQRDPLNEQPTVFIPGQVQPVGVTPHVESDISVHEWLEAEKALHFEQPPESVTVRQYAAVRHFRNNAGGYQKAYRILEGLVDRKRAVKLQTKPACYRLRTPATIEREIRNSER